MNTSAKRLKSTKLWGIIGVALIVGSLLSLTASSVAVVTLGTLLGIVGIFIIAGLIDNSLPVILGAVALVALASISVTLTSNRISASVHEAVTANSGAVVSNPDRVKLGKTYTNVIATKNGETYFPCALIVGESVESTQLVCPTTPLTLVEVG